MWTGSSMSWSCCNSKYQTARRYRRPRRLCDQGHSSALVSSLQKSTLLQLQPNAVEAAFIIHVSPTKLLQVWESTKVFSVQTETVDANIGVEFPLHHTRYAHLDFNGDGVRLRKTDTPILDTGQFLTIVWTWLAQKSTSSGISRFLNRSRGKWCFVVMWLVRRFGLA